MNNKIVEILKRYYRDMSKIEALKEQLDYYSKIQDEKSKNLQEIRSTIQRLDIQNKIVEKSLSNLSEKEKNFIELRYGKNLKYIEIYRKVFIPERTCQRINEKVIRLLEESIM